MNINWAAIGVVFSIVFALGGGIVALWVKSSTNATEIDFLKQKCKELESSHNAHETLNQITFSKIEGSIKEDINKVFDQIKEIYKLLIEKKA